MSHDVFIAHEFSPYYGEKSWSVTSVALDIATALKIIMEKNGFLASCFLMGNSFV